MKRALLSAILGAFACVAMAQPVNLGFELWSQNYLYAEPDSLASTNNFAFAITGQPNVTRVSSGGGNYGVRVENVLQPDNSVLAGYVANDAAFLRGVPFNQSPTEATIRVRHDLAPGDTGGVFLFFKRQGIPYFFDENFFILTGTETNWTDITQTLNVPLPPDSLFFIASSFNLFSQSGSAGSWLEVDHITLNSMNQVYNHSFENWSDIEVEEPAGWVSSNTIGKMYNATNPVTVTKVSPGHEGTYAARIEVKEVDLFGIWTDTMGYIFNFDPFSASGDVGGIPYTDKPTKLSFYYTYAPVGNDSAEVAILFSKWNAANMESDSINGGGIFLGAAATFAKAELLLDWTSIANPDSMAMVIAAGKFTEANAMVPGSVLVIDAVAFEFPTGLRVPIFDNSPLVRIFPNPGTDHINIRFVSAMEGLATLKVYNVLGQVMYQGQNPADEGFRVPTNLWNGGTYIYELSVEGKSYTGKFMIK